MRGFVSIVVAVVITALLTWVVIVQNDAYSKKAEYVRKCGELGGFTSEVTTGWIHVTLQCSIKPATTTNETP